MYDELIARLRGVEEMLKVAQFEEAANLIEQAADAIEELSKPKWISVTERLPEVNEIVYIIQTYSWQNFEDAAARTIGRWNGRYWEWVYYRPSFQHGTLMDLGIICPGNEYVTHWRPLPEPPKEER